MSTYGSVCTGYEGIGLGLALAGEQLDIRWQAENDPHASKILATRFPDVPNLSDIKTTDWTQVEPVDIFSAGYPCQPFSHAGKRKGTDDERHIWPYIADAISVLRPRVVFLENVAGHLSLGFDRVSVDLAALRYDTQWVVVRAADASAPHGRARLFVLAADASGERHGRRQDADGLDSLDSQNAGDTRERQRSRALPGDRSAETLADTYDAGCSELGRREPVRPELTAAECRSDPASDSDQCGRRPAVTDLRCRQSNLDRCASADTDINGLALVGRQHPEQRDTDRCDSSDTTWGSYEPAIRRWEATIGRPAPRPTEPGRSGERLAPVFVEWMQGLPLGWVTDIDISRNEKLKALGNGVVPQQCALAWRTLTQLAAAA